MKLFTGRQYKTHENQQAGFTIIELMIATLVFSTILVIVTIGVVYFTNSYYKGLNNSATQTTTQASLDSISQAVQFNALKSQGTDIQPGVFCAGTKLYAYDLGTPYKGNPNIAAGLYELDRPDTGCTRPSPLTGGKELLGDNMRLTSMEMIQVSSGASTNGGDIWQISLGVAYGDADLLCNLDLTSGTTGSCDANAPSYALTQAVKGIDTACKIQTGSQFCAVVSLSTIAQQRIVN